MPTSTEPDSTDPGARESSVEPPPVVDLVYDADCPNVASARANLVQALSQLGLAPTWVEHLIGDPASPSRVRGFGSPTILVDGRDVAGIEPGEENCCRIYGTGTSRAVAPAVEEIARVLFDAVARRKGSGGSE